MTERPLVVVTVGTDHHPFTRLISWFDRWMARQGQQVDGVVQYGTAAAPRFGSAVDYLDHPEFLRVAATAQIIVCHGGPATIAECRRLGHLPIVVPRRPELGEHVDDHQLRFTARLAARGFIRVPRDEDEFWKLLDAGVLDPMTYELPIDDEPPVAATVRRFSELVAGLHKNAR
jgi:UDP-N-acetylglucosamine transferase subunit ALG13